MQRELDGQPYEQSKKIVGNMGNCCIVNLQPGAVGEGKGGFAVKCDKVVDAKQIKSRLYVPAVAYFLHIGDDMFLERRGRTSEFKEFPQSAPQQQAFL